jgi:putative phage-type endonuclease
MPGNATELPDCLPSIPVLVDTTRLTEEKWLGYRRRGIGGSDVAAIFGISPFRTARDIYFDKLGINPAWEEGDNWVPLKIGHLLEDLVAEIFHEKTGYPVFKANKIFQHPNCPFMLANVDYFARLPGGEAALVEIKTTSIFAKGHWFRDGMETVPPYYESQGRHYMYVTGLDRIFFCCLLLGSNEAIIRELRRDAAYEDEMAYLERNFWENHVQARIPPPYTEDGDLILESTKRYLGPADKSAPALTFDTATAAKVRQYLDLKDAKENSETYVKQLKNEMDRLKAMIIAEMGASCTALCNDGGVSYTVTANPVRKQEVNRDNLLLMKMQYPDVYEKYVTTSEYRRFSIKAAYDEAA